MSAIEMLLSIGGKKKHLILPFLSVANELYKNKVLFATNKLGLATKKKVRIKTKSS